MALFLLITSFFILLSYFVYKYVYGGNGNSSSKSSKKSGFWKGQPVMRALPPPFTGIIDTKIVNNNNPIVRYANMKSNILTKPFGDWNNNELKYAVQFLRLHYLNNAELGNSYTPTLEQFIPFFQGHTTTCYLTMVTAAVTASINAVLTTRPAYMYLDGIQPSYMLQYYDFLCINKQQRNKALAAQVIQAHIDSVSKSSGQAQIGLFKREDELTDIIPLTKYETVCFDMSQWTAVNIDAVAASSIVQLPATIDSAQRIRAFLMETNKSVVIFPSVVNIEFMLKTNNLMAYANIQAGHIIALYLFRDNCLMLNRGGSVIHCIGSFKTNNISKRSFIQSAKMVTAMICAKKKYSYIAFEGIADNNLIIQHVQIYYKPYLTSPTAYYFHNFSYTKATISADDVCILV